MEPPDEVQLRRAGVVDAAVVARLNEHVQRLHVDAAPDLFTPLDPGAAQAFFADRLAAGNSLVWIAERGEAAVGYLYAEEVHRDANPFTVEQHALHVHHLAVDPAARRRGVGSALFTAAQAHAETHGLTALHLDSWLFNEPAHAFFRRLGFAPFVVRFQRVVAPLPTPPDDAER